MTLMPFTVLMASSSLSTTRDSMVSGSAPGYTAVTVTMGNSTSGYISMGIFG